MTKILFSFIIIITLLSHGVLIAQSCPCLDLKENRDLGEAIMKEIWKDIPGYENIYQISNLGRIKSLDRIIICKNKKNIKRGKILKVEIVNNGYERIQLHKNNKCKRYKMHRLVAQAFISNPEKKPYVNHKNGIKNDNRVINLEWCTQSENILHAYKTGLRRSLKGENHGRALLTRKDVLNIRYILKNKEITSIEIAKRYNISVKAIDHIKHRRTWKHI